MATVCDVLSMLCPAGGWIITENDFDSIVWVDDRPRCTKEQFEEGFAEYDSWKAEQDSAKVAQKEALLNRLVITQDEAKLLLA